MFVTAGTSIDEPQSDVVNYLRSTYSWFTCWSEGQINSGGTYTWYFTEGDDNGNWGWIPSNDLYTSYGFGLNPSAYGLPTADEPAESAHLLDQRLRLLQCGEVATSRQLVEPAQVGESLLGLPQCRRDAVTAM